LIVYLVVDPLENGARNYERLLDGPWVFGLCNNNEGRYFVVQKRDKYYTKLYKEGLLLGLQYIPIAGQDIMDYRNHGYNHYVVNHIENFVDPISKAGTYPKD